MIDGTKADAGTAPTVATIQAATDVAFMVVRLCSDGSRQGGDDTIQVGVEGKHFNC